MDEKIKEIVILIGFNVASVILVVIINILACYCGRSEDSERNYRKYTIHPNAISSPLVNHKSRSNSSKNNKKPGPASKKSNLSHQTDQSQQSHQKQSKQPNQTSQLSHSKPPAGQPSHTGLASGATSSIHQPGHQQQASTTSVASGQTHLNLSHLAGQSHLASLASSHVDHPPAHTGQAHGASSATTGASAAPTAPAPAANHSSSSGGSQKKHS